MACADPSVSLCRQRDMIALQGQDLSMMQLQCPSRCHGKAAPLALCTLLVLEMELLAPRCPAMFP